MRHLSSLLSAGFASPQAVRVLRGRPVALWRGLRLFALALTVALTSLACGPRELLAPFLDVTVAEIPANTTQLQIDATFAGKTRTDMAGSGQLGRFTISLPAGSRGRIDIQATARDAQGCIVAIGQLSQEFSANQVYTATLTLAAKQPPICATGMRTVTLNKTGGGAGSITANPAELSCDKNCPSKMVQLQAGTVVSLAVDAPESGPGWTSTFDGWSGACSGMNTCIIPLSQDTTVTARFTCHGWCPESLPGETTNLNAVWGFSSNRVVAVGEGGRILQWNGTAWKAITSPVTANLRGLHGTTTGIGIAVGDGGTILKTSDFGDTWTTQNSTTTVNLRSVWLLDGTEGYIVGDNLAMGKPWLQGDTMTWSQITRMNVDQAWNAVWGYASISYFAVGNAGKSVVSNSFFIPADATAALNGLYGTSKENMTAVGVGSTLLRYDTANQVWKTMNRPAGTGFVNLRSIHGSSENAMFTVGDGGTVWFYDGATWSVDAFPGQTQLNDVYVASASEVYVVGVGGVIYHKKP